MGGALLAASLTGRLHQLTASTAADGRLLGHGVRDGQAMIATLRHRLIRLPARLVHHAGTLTLRLPPGTFKAEMRRATARVPIRILRRSPLSQAAQDLLSTQLPRTPSAAASVKRFQPGSGSSPCRQPSS